jgi:CheY-like chemotaxis protein
MAVNGKRKVLIVDDERVIADTLAIILNQHGYEASAAYSGNEAVEKARAVQPDLIISDVIMQDMNGIEAAIHPRARSCCSPGRLPLPTFWKTPARKATSSRSWPNPCIRPTC